MDLTTKRMVLNIILMIFLSCAMNEQLVDSIEATKAVDALKVGNSTEDQSSMSKTVQLNLMHICDGSWSYDLKANVEFLMRMINMQGVIPGYEMKYHFSSVIGVSNCFL